MEYQRGERLVFARAIYHHPQSIVHPFRKASASRATGNDTAQYELLSQAADHRNELNDAWEKEYMRQLAGRAR